MTRALWLVGAALLIGFTGSLAAQTDEQTQDYEDQDRRYYERYMREQEEEPEAEPEPQPDPATEDERLAAEFVARAEELIKDRNYWGRDSDLYSIETDDPNLDSKSVLGLLDSFRSFFVDFWQPRVELTPYHRQSRVFLFRSFYKYNQMLGFDARRMPLRPEGHYISAFNVMVVHTQAGSPAGFANAVVHEAAHQLIDQQIYGGSDLASIWVGEGLATYFGYTYRNKSGEYQAGRTGSKSTPLFKGVSPGSDNEPSLRLRALRKSLKSAEPGWLKEMLDADPQQFYGGNIELNYTSAWVLVHYLLHGDDGSHGDAFASYLESEAAGTAGSEVLYEVLESSAEQLEAAVAAYAGKIKT
jgi:hypothetical protein